MELTSVGKVILGALRSGERSGYEIKRLVDHATRFFWAASYGQIYPELRRLESAALIEGSSAPRGGRARRVYTLTPAGQAAIQDWLTDPEVGYELRDEALLKLFFADALNAEQALALVRAIRAHRERVLARMREIERSLPAEAEGFPLVVLEYGIELHEWMVSWCGKTERRLASRTRTAGREAGAA